MARFVRLGDVATSSYGFTASATAEDTGARFLRITDIVNGTPGSYDSTPFVETGSADVSKFELKRGDVVIARTGATVGTTHWFTGWPEPVLFASYLVRFTPIADIVNSRFLGYVLRSSSWSEHVYAHAYAKSAQPNMSARAMAEYQFQLPPLAQQQKTAAVLGSLDDKIAANNDVVSASNELIRNLYRALPASSRTLNEVASLVKNNEQPHRFLPDKRLVGLEHFDPKSLWLPRSSEPETATSAKTKFQAGDTLFGKLRPYFHKVAIAPFGGYCSTDILVLRAANPLYSPLVAAAANSDAVVQQAVNSSNGTRMPRAKWTDIEGCPIPDPDAPATLEFIDFAATLIQDATARLDENKALAKTRDELLPLLMSGKITVREAGQEAAAAGVQVPSEENEV